MKLVTYRTGKEVRVGVIKGDLVVDCGVVVEHIAKRISRSDKRAGLKRNARRVLATGPAPRAMIELLERGDSWRKALDEILDALVESGAPGPRGLFTPLAKARLCAPIGRPPKIVCVGLNYADHAREQGIEPPDRPIFFLKSGNAICGPGDPIVLPLNSSQVDYEAELAVVIGKSGKNIPEDRTYEYIAGYTILNDVSARDMQFGDKQWYRGKSCDTFAPTGPWIVTRDEVPDPHNLGISLTLNGETMQDSNTSDLIFKVPYLVHYLSLSMTWQAGDLISTGTPPGVGVFRKPPVFLKAGDTVSVSVEKLGTLTNPVAES